MFAETLVNTQHSTLLTPESRSFTFFVTDFCFIPLYSMFLIPGALYYFGFGCCSHFCVAFIFGDAGLKYFSYLSCLLPSAFVWDSVYVVLCLPHFSILVWSFWVCCVRCSVERGFVSALWILPCIFLQCVTLLPVLFSAPCCVYCGSQERCENVTHNNITTKYQNPSLG
jgi:hypothetical protein